MVSRSSDVFKIVGSMQFMSGLSLLIGLLSFPAGWDNDEVRGVCGPEADDYKLGSCGVRWAFALAVIALFDTIILGKSEFSPLQLLIMALQGSWPSLLLQRR